MELEIKQIEKKIGAKFHLARVPSAEQIGESQLLGLIKKIHSVEIDETGIEKYLPQIYTELADMDKETLIKRIVSMEFSRFLDYYRNAPEPNVDITRDHKGSGSERGSSLSITSRAAGKSVLPTLHLPAIS